MTWIYRGRESHECDPPEKPLARGGYCDVESMEDIWQCDECKRCWVPRASSSFIGVTFWEELKGLKLLWRLHKIRRQQGVQNGQDHSVVGG